MADAAKSGAVGILAVLGIGFARFGDDCGRAASRGARLADDVVVDGSRMGRVAGEAPSALGGVAKWGPEGAAAARVGGDVVPHNADELAGAIVEGTVDVAMEVLPLAGDSEPLPEVEGRLACPTVHDLREEPGAWPRFLDGFGIACAPSIFVAPAPTPRHLQVGDDALEVTDMARACAKLPATCVFIGCDPADERCSEQAGVVVAARSHPDLHDYVASVTRQQLDGGAYAFVAATVDGELMLFEPGQR